jgi:hypothetical protein
MVVGTLGSSRSFINCYFFFVFFRTDVVFFTRSVTSHLQPTMSGRLREERQRRCTIDTV